MRLVLPLLAALAAVGTMGPALAETPSFTLTIRDHQFEPTELQVPAGQRFELHVVNQDKSAEEFESSSLHREKIVPAGSQITLQLGPLKPGQYDFFGDFHPKSARGHIVAK